MKAQYFSLLNLVSKLIPSSLSNFIPQIVRWPVFKNYRARQILDFLITLRIQSPGLQEIEVLIPATFKDFGSISRVIRAVEKYSLNPISRISLVVPDAELKQFASLNDEKVEILSEEKYLSKKLIDCLVLLAPPQRRGWVIQQLIKFSYAAQAKVPVLVLDADTEFVAKVLFVSDDKRQLLCLSHEYQNQYEEHYRKYISLFLPNSKAQNCYFSFVTHYQIMNPPILREIFRLETFEDLDSKLIDWIKLGDFSQQQSPFSEYHTYGRFVLDNHPHLLRFEGWRNLDIRNSDIGFVDKVPNIWRSQSAHVNG